MLTTFALLCSLTFGFAQAQENPDREDALEYLERMQALMKKEREQVHADLYSMRGGDYYIELENFRKEQNAKFEKKRRK
jgi:hypothetical protein